MIRKHRNIHKLVWIVLAPVLVAAVLMLSNVDRNLYPINEQAATQSGKGALP